MLRSCTLPDLTFPGSQHAATVSPRAGESGRPLIQPAVANGVAYNGFVRDNRCRAPPVVFGDMGIRTRNVHSFETTPRDGTHKVAFGMSTSVASSWPPPAIALLPSNQPAAGDAASTGAGADAMQSRPGTAGSSAWGSIFGSSRPGTAATTLGRMSSFGGSRPPTAARTGAGFNRSGTFDAAAAQERRDASLLVAGAGGGPQPPLLRQSITFADEEERIDGGATATVSGRADGSSSGGGPLGPTLAPLSDVDTDGEEQQAARGGGGGELVPYDGGRDAAAANAAGSPEPGSPEDRHQRSRRVRLKSAGGAPGTAPTGREALRGTVELSLQQPWYGLSPTPRKKSRGRTPSAAEARRPSTSQPGVGGPAGGAAGAGGLHPPGSARRHGTADPKSPRRLSPTRALSIGRGRPKSDTGGELLPNGLPGWLGSRALLHSLRPATASGDGVGSPVKWLTGDPTANPQDASQQHQQQQSPPPSPGRFRPAPPVSPSPWAKSPGHFGLNFVPRGRGGRARSASPSGSGRGRSASPAGAIAAVARASSAPVGTVSRGRSRSRSRGRGRGGGRGGRGRSRSSSPVASARPSSPPRTDVATLGFVPPAPKVTDLGAPLPITMGGYPRGKTPGISFVPATTPRIVKLQTEFTTAQQVQDTALLGTLYRLAKDRPHKYQRLVEAFAKVSGKYTYVGDKDKELADVKRHLLEAEARSQVEAVGSQWFVTIANHCSKAIKLHGRLTCVTCGGSPSTHFSLCFLLQPLASTETERTHQKLLPVTLCPVSPIRSLHNRHGEALLSEAVTTMLLQGSTFNREDFRIAVQKLWQSDHVHSGCQTLIQLIKEMLYLSREEYLSFYSGFLPSDQVEIAEAYDRARHAIHETNAIVDAAIFVRKTRQKVAQAKKAAEEEALFLGLPGRKTHGPLQRVSTWSLEVSRSMAAEQAAQQQQQQPQSEGEPGTPSPAMALHRDVDMARKAAAEAAAGGGGAGDGEGGGGGGGSDKS